MQHTCKLYNVATMKILGCYVDTREGLAVRTKVLHFPKDSSMFTLAQCGAMLAILVTSSHKLFYKTVAPSLKYFLEDI